MGIKVRPADATSESDIEDIVAVTNEAFMAGTFCILFYHLNDHHISMTNLHFS